MAVRARTRPGAGLSCSTPMTELAQLKCRAMIGKRAVLSRLAGAAICRPHTRAMGIPDRLASLGGFPGFVDWPRPPAPAAVCSLDVDQPALDAVAARDPLDAALAAFVADNDDLESLPDLPEPDQSCSTAPTGLASRHDSQLSPAASQPAPAPAPAGQTRAAVPTAQPEPCVAPQQAASEQARSVGDVLPDVAGQPSFSPPTVSQPEPRRAAHWQGGASRPRRQHHRPDPLSVQLQVCCPHSCSVHLSCP